MNRCFICSKRIWFWQIADRMFNKDGMVSWVHRKCFRWSQPV